MFEDNEPKTQSSNEISLNCDLSTFSLDDLDERVVLLEKEIIRLKEERKKKSNSLDTAQSFFKK